MAISIIGVYDRDVTQNNVVNTVVETTVYSKSILGGALGTSGKLRLSTQADYLNNSGTAKGLTTRIKYGATTVATFGGDGSITTNANRYAIVITCELSAFNATGAQSAYSTYMRINNAQANTGVDGVPSPDLRAMHNAVAEDSTLAKNLDITVQHSAADANVSFRMNVVHLEYLP